MIRTALVIWETRPAGRTAEFFSAILHEYRDVFERAKPSPLVQRIVYTCLAPFGRSGLEPVDRIGRA